MHRTMMPAAMWFLLEKPAVKCYYKPYTDILLKIKRQAPVCLTYIIPADENPFDSFNLFGGISA